MFSPPTSIAIGSSRSKWPAHHFVAWDKIPRIGEAANPGPAAKAKAKPKQQYQRRFCQNISSFGDLTKGIILSLRARKPEGAKADMVFPGNPHAYQQSRAKQGLA